MRTRVTLNQEQPPPHPTPPPTAAAVWLEAVRWGMASVSGGRHAGYCKGPMPLFGKTQPSW